MSLAKLLLWEFLTAGFCMMAFMASVFAIPGNSPSNPGRLYPAMDRVFGPLFVVFAPICLGLAFGLHWTSLAAYQTLPLKMIALVCFLFALVMVLQLGF